MTYDQWKTTDPREYLLDDTEDAPTELERVQNDLWYARQETKNAAAAYDARIAELTAAMKAVHEYFKDQFAVLDGDGEPRPSREMGLAMMIDQTLHGIVF